MTKKDQKMRKRAARNLEGRTKHHFGREDIWSFFTINAKAQIHALKTLRDDGNGHPGEFDSMEEWNKVLDKMIDGWQAVLDQDDLEWSPNYKVEWEACQERFKAGLKAYAKYYQALWD